MHVIQSRNVNDAYQKGLELIWLNGYTEESRAGPVHVATSPVTTVYSNPMERVLFDESRDANPFFHLFESIWMLAGRRDATWLDRFVSDFSSRFAEPDSNGMAWGAYGHRWRGAFVTKGPTTTEVNEPMTDDVFDQIARVGEIFRSDPLTRRAVIQMWDAELDLGANKRDLPCNTQIILTNRMGRLDFSVINRSNDLVWGAYGANAVHMSFMHEVLAALCELEVGVYNQISINFHMYKSVAKTPSAGAYDPYDAGVVATRPLIAPKDSAAARTFIQDCENFCANHTDGDKHSRPISSAWFLEVAGPMLQTHTLWKNGETDRAFSSASRIRASDWRKAVIDWMLRRLVKREAKQIRSA